MYCTSLYTTSIHRKIRNNKSAKKKDKKLHTNKAIKLINYLIALFIN